MAAGSLERGGAYRTCFPASGFAKTAISSKSYVNSLIRFSSINSLDKNPFFGVIKVILWFFYKVIRTVSKSSNEFLSYQSSLEKLLNDTAKILMIDGEIILDLYEEN